MVSPAAAIQPIADSQPRAVAFMSTRVARLQLFTMRQKSQSVRTEPRVEARPSFGWSRARSLHLFLRRIESRRARVGVSDLVLRSHYGPGRRPIQFAMWW
jgi:hypothetical protein